MHLNQKRILRIMCDTHIVISNPFYQTPSSVFCKYENMKGRVCRSPYSLCGGHIASFYCPKSENWPEKWKNPNIKYILACLLKISILL